MKYGCYAKIKNEKDQNLWVQKEKSDIAAGKEKEKEMVYR